MQVFTLCREGEEPGVEEVNTIRIHKIAVQGKGYVIEREHLLAAALRVAYANVDHSRQVISPLGMNWKIAAWLWKAKASGIATGGWITTAPELPEGFWASSRIRLAASLMLPVYDRLIFCSSAQIDVHRRTSWIAKSKCITIPNGVRIDRFRPAAAAEKAELRDTLGLAQDEFLFCYVGNIVERKGIDFLVRVWRSVQSRLPKARLLLIGQRDMPNTFCSAEDISNHAAFEKRLQAALEALDPNLPAVQFVPPTPRVEDWLRASDAFLFPSFCEGLPNALIEAMACGLPSITAPFEGFPHSGEELGSPGREFVLVPHEENLWADAICSLAKDSERRQTMGANACAWVQIWHAYDEVLDRIAHEFHSLAN